MAPTSKLTPEMWRIVHRWEREGRSRPDMVAMIRNQFGVEMTRGGLAGVLGKRGHGSKPAPLSRAYKVYLDPGEMYMARVKARDLGERTAHGGGNVSGLLRGIASGDLVVTRSDDGGGNS